MLFMKKYKQLTSEQRYAIYLGLENGDTQRTIASLIGVSPSAVSRELQRNKDVIRTITTDNGLEFAAHERITEMLEARCTSPTPIRHGKKDRSKTRTSSSGNTSPRGRPSRTIHPTD